MEERVCPGCGEANPANARLCGLCRTTLVADDAADGGKLVTVVTSDLKGSTALGEQLDPESLREVLNRYFAVMRVVFESHGGSIEKIIGDAIVAVFGLPFRHEDDPLRAIEAVAEAERALVTLNAELEKLWGVRLVNRTGVATGIVHFGRDAEGQHVLIGETMDESTAMEQNAPPLEALMADSAYRELRDHVDAEDMGFKSPKGSDLQIRSHRLISVQSRAASEDEVVPEPAPGMRACQVCGEESPDRFRYCVNCGAAAVTIVARDTRKTVTIVFANPKPHTDSGDPLDPKAFTDVMARYFEAMKSALERHGGTVEKFIGDAVMAVFGLPVRHEDDALRAVRAAADMQAALPELNATFEAAYGVRLLNHIGVNTGEVIATGDASTGQRLVTGDTVNTAARLEQAAGAAEIILGELTHRLTRDTIDVDVIPPLMLKGKAEPVPAYRFVRVRERPTERAGLSTQFVGREVEISRLSEALFEAEGHKQARLITVMGDAGVGKSRLIREFAMAAAREATLLRGRCLPYGDGITFWPLAEIVRAAAAIEADDDPPTAIAKIRGLLDEHGIAGERDDVTDRVASMMNLSPTPYPVVELMWGMRRLLEVRAARQPLVIVLDDIHSAEQTFLDFIDYVLETAEGGAILLVASARHELLERHGEWSATHADETITLVPLTEGEVGQLVGELLGDLDPSVRERIATAAEGNPLYTEQIVSMLQETGAIKHEDGRWVSTRASSELTMPPTVQALVAARLDALGTEERAVIDPASVIGLSFAGEAVAELVDDDVRPRLDDDLLSLTGKSLIRKATSDESTYRFGHLVIKDTAYASQLKRVRAELHERFVVWAERVNKERGRETEFEEILGYHLEQAYRYRTELGVADEGAAAVGERAAAKLGAAGRRALARGDLPASISLLRRATDLLDPQAGFRLELTIELGEAHMQHGDFDDAAAALDGALEVAQETGQERFVVRASLIRFAVDLFRSGAEAGAARAMEVATRAISVLEPLDDAAGLARAWRLVMNTESDQFHLDEATTAAEHVIRYARRAGDTRIASRSAGTVAYLLLHGPAPAEEAIRRCAELLADVAGDRLQEATIQSTVAILRAMQGEFDEARSLYQRSNAIVDELGAGIVKMTGSIDSSQVDRLAGDLESAEEALRRDYDALTSIDESWFRSTVAAFLAQVLWDRGDADDAQRFSEVAEALGDADDVLTQVAWRGVRAKIHASQGAPDEALRLVGEAVEVASATAALRLHADALVDLGDVLVAVGQAESSGPPFREALRLYELKGDVVSVGRVRDRISVRS